MVDSNDVALIELETAADDITLISLYRGTEQIGPRNQILKKPRSAIKSGADCRIVRVSAELLRTMTRSLFAVLFALACFCSTHAQDLTPPPAQRISLHSKVLNEDRLLWVRFPADYAHNSERYGVIYQPDAPGSVSEMGSVLDFLADEGRIPPMILVGIGNTDRMRDLTPTRADLKNDDGSIEHYPSSGGGDRFLDFIQDEVIPEIERRYRTTPYRVFSGHSVGALMAIHALRTRPSLFNAYIAASPSLQWDDERELRDFEKFLASNGGLKQPKSLFVSLANEGANGRPIGKYFARLERGLSSSAPKGLAWKSEHFPDETHSSTVLRAHYAGLRFIFSSWTMPNPVLAGGLPAVEQYYRELSQRMGYDIATPENALNRLGYRLLDEKKIDEALTAFRRNIELHPGSANVYDSLGEGLEAAKKYSEATESFRKAVEVAKKNNDPKTSSFERHVDRALAEQKAEQHY